MITVKKDKSVKIALDSRKLNEVTRKRKGQIPNMEETISRISRKILEGTAGERQYTLHTDVTLVSENCNKMKVLRFVDSFPF